jgi:hypothetical protein
MQEAFYLCRTRINDCPSPSSHSVKGELCIINNVKPSMTTRNIFHGCRKRRLKYSPFSRLLVNSQYSLFSLGMFTYTYERQDIMQITLK